jgi:hypothetical protein
MTYEQFMDKIGTNFENANRPRNWLGGEVPFPMNPSFKPPSPISDSIRTEIYQAYMKDPVKNSVRELTRVYHLSLKRVDAILRLKGLEEHWLKEKKQLQTGFLSGMETLLGVQQEALIRKSRPRNEADESRYDVTEADALEEREGRELARQRYQRLFWESVPEDGTKEPVVPRALEKAQQDGESAKLSAEKRKSSSKLMKRFSDTPLEKVKIVEKPGRPTMKFIDVGGKFMDVDERLRRMAESQRRAKVKARSKI